MVKSYLRHGGTEVFGLIVSPTSNTLYDGRLAYAPGCEDVLVWNPRTGTLESMWHATGNSSPVTSLARSPLGTHVAVGYADGAVRIWKPQGKEGEMVMKFDGHRRAVTCLTWDVDGMRLASGSQDGDIVLWDVVGEQGLFRLRGHRDQITGLVFTSAPTIQQAVPSSSTALQQPSTHLLTTAKDTFLKVWDLATQHCLETVLAHRGGSWSLAVFPPTLTNKISSTDVEIEETPQLEDMTVLTSGAEGSASLWKLSTHSLIHGPKRLESGKGYEKTLSLLSSLPLQTPGSVNQRVTGAYVGNYELKGGAKGTLVSVQVGERAVEVWKLRSDEEMKRRRIRRRKRQVEKLNKGKSKTKIGDGDVEMKRNDNDGGDDDVLEDDSWSDRLAPWTVIRSSAGKLRSFSFAPPHVADRSALKVEKPAAVHVLLALSSNAMEVHALPTLTAAAASAADHVTMVNSLTLPGHRTDVRCLAVSSDDQLLASGANGSVKVWNIKSGQCLRTMEGGYALCARWLPGDRHLVVGCKSGELHLYDIASSTLLETFKAHTGSCWGLDLRPDGRGLVSGGADKDVKFWSFEIKHLPLKEEREDVEGDGAMTRRELTMTHTRTLKMSDDVLGVKYTPDGKMVAVSLLDATIKVFFEDSLKFFLSLYGHKLPVLSMDISFDSKLLITCSADKNVKIWGLDFGDCHKSIFAHEESIMQIAFEKKSHLFWTVGKDKLIKYWDGDKFESIQKLEGHHGEVWALCVSNKSNFVISASHDKSIRVWEKTDDILFLEEEREREIENMYTLQDQSFRDLLVKREGHDHTDDGCEVVTKESQESLMAGEKIIEALELAQVEHVAHQTYLDASSTNGVVAVPTKNPIVVASNASCVEEYVLNVIKKIPVPALEDALLVLPFSKIGILLLHLDFWAKRNWSLFLVVRIMSSILRLHHAHLVSTRSHRQLLTSLRQNLKHSLEYQKNVVGYNLAALGFIKQQCQDTKVAQFYDNNDKHNQELTEQQVREQISQASKKKQKVILK